jgi:hypothetical protein
MDAISEKISMGMENSVEQKKDVRKLNVGKVRWATKDDFCLG